MTISIQEQISLSEYSTFKSGGPADFFAVVDSVSQLKKAVVWAEEHTQPWRVIGGGSNILCADEGYRGLIIKNELRGIHHEATNDGVFLTVGAGEILDELVNFTCARGWWGLENLSGIPGTVGAMPIQNVGAYGVETETLLTSVDVLDARTGEARTLTRDECRFSYRHSLFKEYDGKDFIITKVHFFLPYGRGPQCGYKDIKERTQTYASDALTPHVIRTLVLEIRAGKFPDWHTVGTAGSFFKNPIISPETFHTLKTTYPLLPGYVLGDGRVKVQLGWILDHVCHLRGVREGSVGTFETQALVLVNYAHATTSEIKKFAEKITKNVFEKTNIVITWEVTEIS